MNCLGKRLVITGISTFCKMKIRPSLLLHCNFVPVLHFRYNCFIYFLCWKNVLFLYVKLALILDNIVDNSRW